MMQFYRGLKQLILAGTKQEQSGSYLGNGHASLTREAEMAREFLLASLRESRTIVFAREQAEVFMKLSSTYADALDYRLPFSRVFLQFSTPIPVVVAAHGPVKLCCLMLAQDAENDEVDTNLVNSVWVWFEDSTRQVMLMAVFGWDGKSQEKLLATDGTTEDEYNQAKALAIACIGYINCENIYLHQEGEVSAKVNRKREQQGKKVLEPYYVCRISGVQYDSNGEPTGQGTHHGFRYDVRGHFRRLGSGKTTWVRPHQRGLQHELYIPKTYLVERGAKPLMKEVAG